MPQLKLPADAGLKVFRHVICILSKEKKREVVFPLLLPTQSVQA